MTEIPPSTFDELQACITERHQALSKRLQQVSRYVLEHTDSVAFDTLAEIAQAAGVHASTLVRFANAFGYSGFSDMQKLFKTRFLEEQPSYSERIHLLQADFGEVDENVPTPLQIFTEFTRANILSLEQMHSKTAEASINQALDLLENAQSIFVAGVRRSYAAAVYISYALRHIGRPTHLVDGIGGMYREQVSVIGRNDLLLAVSFKPYGEETLSAIRLARAQGAQVILITDSKFNPLVKEAAVKFFVHDAEVRSFRSLVSTLCLAQSLCIGLAFRLEKDHSG
jgi:DNA-binding MurR/RpiR family transcriptional regulator